MLTAGEIMTRDVITVDPDMGVAELATLLWEKSISGAPVVDADGKLVGVVTETDLIDQSKKVHIPAVLNILDSMIMLENPTKLDRELKKMTGARVRDICTADPVTVAEQTPMDELASIMSERHLHTLPVMKDGRLVGVIGKADIIRAMFP
jgi:CBS-domain-containing membrane protein